MYPIIDLHMYKMYFKALLLLNDIRALIFHPIKLQDFESIPMLVCNCIIIAGLRFTRFRLIPTYLTQLHYYHTIFGSKLSQ